MKATGQTQDLLHGRTQYEAPEQERRLGSDLDEQMANSRKVRRCPYVLGIDVGRIDSCPTTRIIQLECQKAASAQYALRLIRSRPRLSSAFTE